MIYGIKRVGAREEIASAPRLSVGDYRWLGGYTPEVRAAVVFVAGEGFAIRMDCAEEEPLALCREPDGPVCRDSCMECFINFAPERDRRYINLEANALAALHCKIGEGRKGRQALRELGVPMPSVCAHVGEAGWRLDFFVPLACVQALYGKAAFSPGDVIRANFYKCGDGTPQPHYGMWRGIESPVPDFHRPEFFGELIIRE